MEKRIRKIEEFVLKCPQCGKEISGFSEEAVKYNLKLHLEAHAKEVHKKS